MDSLYYIQTNVLKELLYKKDAKFSDLNSLQIPSDQLTFHLKQLIKLGYIKKEDSNYSLTASGLEIAGRINTENAQILKQSKVSICILPIRDSIDGKEILVGKRSREQSLGKYAFFTQKVAFGETFTECCEKALLKDTGLRGDFEYCGLAHVIRESGKFVEVDVTVIHFKATNLKGDFINKTLDAENYWMNLDEIKNIPAESKVVGFDEIIENTFSGNTFFKEYISSLS